MTAYVELEERHFAFQNRLQTFSIVNHGHIDLREFFNDAFQCFQSRIEPILQTYSLIKVGTCFCAIFEKIVMTDEGERYERQSLYIHTTASVVDFESDLAQFYDELIVSFVINKIDDIHLRGSGFSLSEIKELNVQVSRFEPIAGLSYIELPKYLKHKQAIINVQNKDNECFKYAILSALFPAARNAQRVSQYKQYENVLNFTGITFPVDLKQITKFEMQNPEISINVYMFDEKEVKVRPLRLTKIVKIKHIHLMLLTQISKHDDVENKRSHYCWIKNLSALLGNQSSSNCRRKLYCDRCLNYYIKHEDLNAHMNDCLKQNQCQIEMPTWETNKVQFENYNKQLKVPFIIYADVESILKKPEENFCKSDSTTAYQQHEAYSIGYYFKCSYDDSKSYYKSERGPHCVDWFVREINGIANDVESILKDVIPLNMSLEDEVFFLISDECHICDQPYKENEPRVRDHSHLTGEYRGSAHANCNLQYQEARYIPVVFHNLSNYDAHFIVEKLASLVPGNVSIVPQNDQLYISFTKIIPSHNTKVFKKFIKFRFIDSFRFMPSALSYLSSLLPPEKKKILKNECNDLSSEQLQMVQRKGVFCYDYLDSWTKLEETSLPPKDQFRSLLTESDISDEDYEFAIKVWDEFNIKTLGEYSDLYLKTDILLLADVFESFRETCYDIYKLDPGHYYTAPGLSFDAMLKYTKVQIELLTDIDMLLFVERGIRGGISQCSKRYSKANNKHMKDHDPNAASKYLMYLDANNLYGFSMMQHLPIKDFEWNQNEFTIEEIMNIPDDASTGYIFEVDLEYPQHLHDKHKDYPLCAETREVPGSKKEKKLLLTLFDKKNYVIHYKMLKFVLQQGLVLKKIHRVLQFTQSQWLKPYIELNTLLRTKATNDFEKNFYKLLINAIYGKTMENLRSRVDIRLRTNWSGRYGVRKLIAMPNFKKFNIFNHDLVAIEMNRTNILMNKPIVIGMSVLDISKVLMYDFYYNHIRVKYGEKVQMAYTDTDSFILELETDCFYTDMLDCLDKYDTSDYPENNIYNLPRMNKKVPGLFKDELNGNILTEFVGLRSKMYCVKCSELEKMKKAKGIKKYVLNKKITFNDYLDCIKNNCTIIREQNTFRSKNHTVFSVRQSKIALSPLDNKRYILDDNINTLPWGHYGIPT